MDEVGGRAPSRGVSAAAPIATDDVCACRKCRITLRGPWQQVPPLRLSDVSLMPCLAQSRMEQVPVWAISEKGDVLCRLGVSPQNPSVRTPASAALARSKSSCAAGANPPTLLFQGSSWLHVGTDQPFKSISIGGASQVWAIARDGAVFYRGSVSQQNPAGKSAELGLVYRRCTLVHL